ncbi:MAG: DUF2892 domain-containing protein [Bacteroidia bacterium]|nr:DUF2892 domain-containing protein [Bacteroidia bacterium]
MKTNISSADRIIRVMIAASTAVLYFTNIVTGTAGIVLMAAGGILLMTSVINFCPIYHVLGISTFRNKITA